MKSKFDSLLARLKEACARFDEVLAQPESVIIRDAAIQRFEFTFELIWKTLKAYLEEKGEKDLFFPKDAIRSAFRAKLVEDDPLWLEMVDTRNETSHIYSEALAQKSYKKFSAYLPLIRKLIDKLS